MMKYVLIPLLSLLATVAMAGPESQKLGEKLADVTGAEKGLKDNFTGNIDSITSQLRNSDPALLTKIKEAAAQFYTANYKWEEIRPVFGSVFAAEFTDEEMKAAIAFFESPTGKKLAEKLPSGTRTAALKVTEKLKDKMPQLQATLVDIVQKHMQSMGGPPPGTAK